VKHRSPPHIVQMQGMQVYIGEVPCNAKAACAILVVKASLCNPRSQVELHDGAAPCHMADRHVSPETEMQSIRDAEIHSQSHRHATRLSRLHCSTELITASNT
jgi:hypothetical protein